MEAAAIPNIGSRGMVLRLRGSVASFAGAFLIVAVLRWLGASWPWLLLTVPPFFGAFSLAYQSLFKTCTFMAADGLRDMGDGREKIANASECELVKVRARRVNLFTLSSTVAATLLMILASR